MKIPLCFIVFLLLPVVKLRPTVAGSMVSNWRLCSPQLWDIQSTTGKRGFATGIMTLVLKL